MQGDGGGLWLVKAWGQLSLCGEKCYEQVIIEAIKRSLKGEAAWDEDLYTYTATGQA